jgi:hypothetical protein
VSFGAGGACAWVSLAVELEVQGYIMLHG